MSAIDDLNGYHNRAATVPITYPFHGEPMHELRWLGVDLDDTLAHAVWPDRGIGRPMYENIRKLREAVEDPKWKVIIFTARPWEDYPVIEAWLNIHDVPWRRIICGKPVLHRMFDDKAVPADAPSWKAML